MEERQTVEVIIDRGGAQTVPAGAEAAPEMTEQPEAPAPKRPRARRAVSHVFFWLLFYNLLMLVLSGLAVLAGAGIDLATAVTPLAAVGLVYLFTRKRWPVKPFETHRKMTGKAFFTFFCLLCTLQVLSGMLMYAVNEAGVSGTSVSIQTDSFFLILYVGFTGPFCEEMMYRGFSAGKLRGYGKLLAIVLSALAFGAMHMNLEQLVVGFLTGLLFGYMFMEYSVLWTVLLHIVNNFCMSTLPGLLFKNAPETADGVMNGIAIVFAVCGIYLLIKNRGVIAAYVRDPANRAEKGTVRQVLTSFWFWVFLVLNIGVAVYLMLDPALYAIVNGLSGM